MTTEEDKLKAEETEYNREREREILRRELAARDEQRAREVLNTVITVTSVL